MFIFWIFDKTAAVLVVDWTAMLALYPPICAWFVSVVTVVTVVTVQLDIVTGAVLTTDTRISWRIPLTALKTFIPWTASRSASSPSLTDFSGVYAIFLFYVIK